MEGGGQQRRDFHTGIRRTYRLGTFEFRKVCGCQNFSKKRKKRKKKKKKEEKRKSEDQLRE
jgi:hypothetical protein